MNEQISHEHAPAVDDGRMATAREAAETLNLPLCWLDRPHLRRQKRVPFHRIGRNVRFKLDELQAWMLQRAQEGGGRA